MRIRLIVDIKAIKPIIKIVINSVYPDGVIPIDGFLLRASFELNSVITDDRAVYIEEAITSFIACHIEGYNQKKRSAEKSDCIIDVLEIEIKPFLFPRFSLDLVSHMEECVGEFGDEINTSLERPSIIDGCRVVDINLLSACDQ